MIDQIKTAERRGYELSHRSEDIGLMPMHVAGDPDKIVPVLSFYLSIER